jgi:hypothetical protein
LISLFPRGPSDLAFNEMLHLILQISVEDCWNELFQRGHSTVAVTTEERFAARNLLKKMNSINICLVNQLQRLQCLGLLSSRSFAVTVLESCPPGLTAVFSSLLNFYVLNQEHKHYSSSPSSIPASLRSSVHNKCHSTSHISTDSETASGPDFLKQIGKYCLSIGFLLFVFLDHVGSSYYQQFNRIYELLYALPVKNHNDGDKSTPVAPSAGDVSHHQKKQKSPYHVEQSHFRENMELYNKLLKQMDNSQANNANRTCEEEKDDCPHSQASCLPVLHNYAKICFDIHQKEILPMRISIQCFIIVALRVMQLS